MNSVNIIGRIARDPELKLTKDNLAIFTTSIAVQKGKDKGAIFLNIKAFDKTATNMERFFTKGMLIAVSGKLDVEEWNDKEGKKRTNTVVIVQDFTFCEKKKEAETENETASIPKADEGTGFYTMADPEEDLPF